MCVCTAFVFSEVHNELFGLLGVEGQVVVCALCRQVLDLLPANR